jgi:tRNA(Ile)-lysidine synthase
MAVGVTAQALSQQPWPARGPIVFAAEKFAGLPAEVALRLLGRAIAQTGDEGPVELGKLEALYQALGSAKVDGGSRWRRTLGGALVTLTTGTLAVERAPARRRRAKDTAKERSENRRIALTTEGQGGRGGANRR